MRATTLLASALLVLALTGLVEGQGAEKKRPPGKTIPSKTPFSKEPFESAPVEIGGKTLPQWKAQLAHKDASRREEAVITITMFGPAASGCVPLLVGRTSDSDTSPKVRAIIALRMIEVREKDVPLVVQALVKRINPPPEGAELQGIVRYEALRTLGRFAGDAHVAIPALARATRDTNSYAIRQLAVKVLARAGVHKGSPDVRAINALLVSMKTDTTFHVRLEAIQGLGILGPPADANVAARVRADLWQQYTASSNTSLRLWSLPTLVASDSEALDKKSTDSALKKLGGYLHHAKDKQARINAASALGALGKRAKPQVPALIALTANSTDPVMIQAACAALSGIGDNSDRVVDAMIDVLGHKDPNCVVAACGTLLQLNAGGARVLAALKQQLDRADLKKELLPYIKHTIDELKKPVLAKPK